jgi:ribosome-associated protein
MEFSLEGRDYIELNKLLKICRLADSGGMANQLIVDEQVTVNGALEIQKRKKLRAGDVVVFDGQKISVTV